MCRDSQPANEEEPLCISLTSQRSFLFGPVLHLSCVIQTAYAKALLVNRTALREAQEAYETDVRPWLSEFRVRQGRNPDPIADFRASGYAERVARERVGNAVGSGYPGA